MIKNLITCALLIISAAGTSLAQNNAVATIQKFGDNLTEWSRTGSDQSFIEIDNSTHGHIGCRVDNGLMKLFVKQDETGLLQEGAATVDSYLNCLTKAIDRDMKITHGTPLWQKDYEEPTYSSKNDEPLYFVSMDLSTTHPVPYTGSDLYFVRGNYITKIVDFNDNNSMARAIRLYSEKKYDEAFRLFRAMAYADPLDFDSQYYTAVMEIKKQGCSHLSPKIRDMEAAWWLTRGSVSNTMYQRWSTQRMAELYNRFGVDENKLPYNIHGLQYYKVSLMQTKLCSEGLMVYKKKNLYGYMDEKGNLAIPCIYNTALNFNSNGLARVSQPRGVGFVNKLGQETIPLVYQSAMAEFKEGKTFVIKDGALFLIDEKGDAIKFIGNDYDWVGDRFVGGACYALHKPTQKCHLYDINGNYVTQTDEMYSINLMNCSYIDKSSGEPKEIVFDWK